MRFGRSHDTNERLLRLARKIQAMKRRDEERHREAQEVGALRARAASELHALCLNFVDAVNRLLPEPMLELSPSEYSDTVFRDHGANVYQLAVSGRILHLEFRATEALTSTEKFRVPYVLEGAVRAFNQDLLDLAAVPERPLFCCLERGRTSWLCLDPRTQRVVPMDQEQLAGLLEPLL